MSVEKIVEELEEIRKSNGGLLMPAQVVEFAKNPETALHARFTWEDTEAAQRWRLHEAREVIRVHVTVIGESAEPVRAYVSLSTDRRDGGGYRAVVDILESPEQHAQMVADALNELRAFKRKYDHLTALRPLWRAMEDLEAKVA